MRGGGEDSVGWERSVVDRKRSFYLLCLGCPKNEVDSDYLASALMSRGWHMRERPEDAGVIVVNTCSFMVPAVEESIESILELGDTGMKGDRRLVVTGCLVSRYGKQALSSLLPEVDIFVDFEDYPRFGALMEGVPDGSDTRGVLPRGHASTLSRGYVYVKICEGCARRCSFCTIPLLRGPLRSRPWEEIREEARFFLARGAREIVLIAQDTTSYGMDIYGRPSLPMLVDELCEEDGDWTLRIMYMHPEGIDADVVDAMRHPRVANYLDLPFQHVDAGILEAMGRKGDARSHRELLASLAESLHDLALRATFIVGFPGEDRTAFASLYDFVAEMRFDWLGLFSYSQEEGTPAFSLGKGAEASVAKSRIEELSALQDEIMRENALDMVGKRVRVLVEGRSLEADGFWEARSWREAPEIDGVIFIPHEGGISAASVREARIVATEGIDLVGDLQSQ
ncbi:MAG: 30S ribosomal protein S12 methylthiotransferase RimO [Actinobacteria bacterium]|nr:MAG: 30S ribosomal protein S12 methylthiotransferase RimO [Actinomycetota bacterium]